MSTLKLRCSNYTSNKKNGVGVPVLLCQSCSTIHGPSPSNTPFAIQFSGLSSIKHSLSTTLSCPTLTHARTWDADLFLRGWRGFLKS